MVSNWKKAVFAWSFGMVWGFTQALVQFVYRNFIYDPFYYMKGKYLEHHLRKDEQPDFELTKEEQESCDALSSDDDKSRSDDEWVSAQRYKEEAVKCDRMYRKAEAEYLEVMRTTEPDDPIREKYRPKPFPSGKEIKESFFRHCGMFTN